jgi:hypothetical protein
MQRLNHLVLTPNADFQHLSRDIRNEVKLYFFAEGHVWDWNVLVEEGDLAITIHDAGVA